MQSPTGDMLVNQLRTGSLDAVVAYVSNAAGAADELEAIPIDIPCALAVQPLAVSKDSRATSSSPRRLIAAPSNPRLKAQRFVANGFGWKLRGGRRLAVPADRLWPGRAPTDARSSSPWASWAASYVAPDRRPCSSPTLLLHLPRPPRSAPCAAREIRYAVWLSLISCSVTTILSLWVAVPLGYLLSRWSASGRLLRRRELIDAIARHPHRPAAAGHRPEPADPVPDRPGPLDREANRALVRHAITYAVPSVILAQFAVAAAFAVRDHARHLRPDQLRAASRSP